MKATLIAIVMGAGLSAMPAEAALYNFTITGEFIGSGSFTTLDTESDEYPGGYEIIAMSGTFNGATIIGIQPPGTLFADNMYYESGLHVGEGGWTFRAGTRDYNMFLSEVTDATGTYDQLLVGYPGIGRSRRVSLSVTPASVPVPEPTTLSIVGLGVAGLGLVARRRKAKAGEAAA